MTEKDKVFLEKLKRLMESKDLWVVLKPGEPSHMVLKGTYGSKIHETFGITRQGIRWRFHHLFSRAYVGAFETWGKRRPIVRVDTAVAIAVAARGSSQNGAIRINAPPAPGAVVPGRSEVHAPAEKPLFDLLG